MAFTGAGAAREQSASAIGATYKYPIAQMKWNAVGQITSTWPAPAVSSPTLNATHAMAKNAHPTAILTRSPGSVPRRAWLRQNHRTTGARTSTASESSD